MVTKDVLWAPKHWAGYGMQDERMQEGWWGERFDWLMTVEPQLIVEHSEFCVD